MALKEVMGGSTMILTESAHQTQDGKRRTLQSGQQTTKLSPQTRRFVGKEKCSSSLTSRLFSSIREPSRLLYNIFLFTASDLKTIVFPETAFAISSSLSGSLLFQTDLGPPLTILSRVPLVMLWIWINLLPFAIDNQRQPLAIEEDRQNKPWRPLQTGYITPRAAKRIMFTSYIAAFLVSVYLGTTPQCLALIALGLVYNDLGGADRSCIVRNLNNAAGFISFGSGAMIIAGYPSSLNWASVQWFALIFQVVFSTVHMQDLPDQQGDAARGRKTVPLVVGDRKARWMVCVGVLFWSLVAPAFWELGLRSYAPTILLGSLISTRVLLKTSVAEDKTTFIIWNMWMGTLYLLPCLKRLVG